MAGLGLTLGVVLLVTDLWLPRALYDYDLHQVPSAACLGLALGGALVALVTAPARSRAAITAGLAIGLSAGLGVVTLAERLLSWSGALELWVLGSAIAVTLVTALLVAIVDRGDQPAGSGHARAWRPLAVVAAVVAIALLTEAVRRSVVVAMRVPPQRRITDVMAVDATVRVGLALAAGAALVWFAYRYATAAAARWVCTGFALGLPLLLGLDRGFYTASPWPEPRASGLVLLAVVVVAAATGVVLVRVAAQVMPWEAFGLLLAAAALAMRIGQPDGGLLPTYLLAVGVGLALAAGLAQVASEPDRLRTPERAGPAPALGFAAALVVCLAMAPSLQWGWAATAYGPLLLVRPMFAPMLVVLGALGAVIFCRLDRAASRSSPSGVPEEDRRDRRSRQRGQ